ncbi:MAG: helix-turn-helix domain-containing protein [Chloroflexota bacterium]|nr:helix-turn-helix domain-containing protein [Chloroflexota bacterium]
MDDRLGQSGSGVESRALDAVDPVTIGERLAEARRARRLTQQQAAEELGVARTTITAMEKGERRPRPAELLRLAQLYGRRVGDLVRPGPPAGEPSFVVQFRATRAPVADTTDEERDADIRRFQELCRDYVELERLVGAPLPRRYPDPYDVSGTSPERAAEEVASSERNRLGLGDGPIGDPWTLLETDVGLRIFAPPFEGRRIAGMFVYTEEYGGCIAVNGDHPEERRRWTLVHDYAHFLTDRHRPDIAVLQGYRRVPEAERFADAFARFFLLPTSGLTRRFQAMRRAKNGPVTPADLLALSHLFGVSVQAMVWRLEELRLLPAGTWDKLHALGFKPAQARELAGLPPMEPARGALPLRYELLAVQAYDQGLLSEGELARYLRTDRVGARRRVEELTAGEPYFDDGAWRQLRIDLAAALVGSGAAG